VGTRFSTPVQTGPWAHPASCTMGTGSFPAVKSGRDVTLTPHPFLVPWSRKGGSIPLLPLWAVRPVQSLSACTRVHFNFTLQGFQKVYTFIYLMQYSYIKQLRQTQIQVSWYDTLRRNIAMIAKLSSETSVTIYQLKRCHIPKETDLREHCYGNFKSLLMANVLYVFFDVVSIRFGSHSNCVKCFVDLLP
jgi:hypothetical protein